MRLPVPVRPLPRFDQPGPIWLHPIEPFLHAPVTPGIRGRRIVVGVGAVAEADAPSDLTAPGDRLTPADPAFALSRLPRRSGTPS